MAMGFCSTAFLQPVRLHAFLFLVVSFIFSPTSVSATGQLSYSHHCGSVVPESRTTRPEFTTSRLSGFSTGYFSGGSAIVDRNSSSYSPGFSKSLTFRTRSLHGTETKGVFKVEAGLVLSSDGVYYYGEDLDRRRPTFPRMEGFWSESSGKLCMVGVGSVYSKGSKLRLSAVLKLNNVKSSNNINDLVTGTLESLDASNDFDPISMLFIPEVNYKYTVPSSGCADAPATPSLSTDSMNSVCSLLSSDSFELEYSNDCNPSRNCSPFGGTNDYLPQFLSIRHVHCSEDEDKLQVMVKFQNTDYDYYGSFDPSTTLIAEGSWDEKKTQLCLVGCRILTGSNSPADAQIGDCSIRLSLRFPEILSIRNRSIVLGEIWSSDTVNNPGLFSKILFHSTRNMIPASLGIPGQRYEYTEIQRARKFFLEKKPAEGKGEAYPSESSSNLQFDLSVQNSTHHQMGWAYSELITLGDKFNGPYVTSLDEPGVAVGASVVSEMENSLETKAGESRTMNVSYRITLSLYHGVQFGGIVTPTASNFSRRRSRVEIIAEGIYDAKTGFLCLVGCRKLNSSLQTYDNGSMDCEILVNLQFPPLNSKNSRDIKGSMESTRKKSDPLYFEHLDLSAYSSYGARESIWRMDFEVIMVLVSHTLSCVFVGLQIFYVKKHSKVLPSVSLVMLVFLTLGYMIPLVLNFEALFLGSDDRQNDMLESRGWLKANEVAVRVSTMVVFLLQFRLLQLTWAAKLKEVRQKGSWAAEKKVLYLAVSLYAAVCLIALFFNSTKSEYGDAVQSYPVSDYLLDSIWRDLRSFAGLVLDGFLFPQILLNIFTSSTEKALSHSFYVGTTCVRLLPHAYDLYRARNNDIVLNGSYIYANPGADFYSTAWDLIIPCGGLLFCAIIFLQQCFGGRCILPKRFRESAAYEKIPVVNCENDS